MYAKPKDQETHATINCQNNGTWDYEPFKCEQLCGAIDNTTESNVLSGLKKPDQVPWHINIYSLRDSNRNQYVCGGTLIQSKIVISAAHCFWDEKKSMLYDRSKYIVTAGKFDRNYYSDRETFEVQRAFISKIYVPANFRGLQNNFDGDIAVLTLTNHIKFRNHIVPACVDWSFNASKYEQLGLFIGLGVVDQETNYAYLRSVNVKGISSKACKENKLIENYDIPDDKLCVSSQEQNERICKADSGGGFIYYNIYPRLGYLRSYYLAGTFSNIIRNTNKSNLPECDESSVRAFTSIQVYESFVKNVINNLPDDEELLTTQEPTNAISSNTSLNCLVPINNLILTNTETNMQLEPGIVITTNILVNYSCPEGYVLDGVATNTCNRKSWRKMHPQCIKTCSPIQGHTTRIDYYYNEKLVEFEEFIKPGTIARIKCATMYKKPQKYLIYEDLRCQTDGEWDYEPFECEQICGTVDNNVPFSVNSVLTQPSKVPWHVAIYGKDRKQKFEHLCGGTIIKSKIIITAAHCFWNPSELSIRDKSNFIVFAGKFYRDYYADNEKLEIQKITISKIHIPRTFNGANYDWANDIAALTLNDHIVYRSHIRPVCLTWKEQSEQYIQSNLPGVVAGWGITDNGLYSSELRSVELLSIDSHTCKTKKITRNDNIAADKFCVETGEGKNVCPGDSGGGFVVPTEVNNKILYNLWGVVSNGIIGRGDLVPQCNSNFITTFTNVQYYRQMISDVILQAYQ
ncbi:modular serine protease-like isoform X2 [Condylostylus longicornis]|nr:modular serine protease-like isoform X2 [Condylostylus longicornis]